MNDKNRWISDSIDMSQIKSDEFNLIVAGCGTGKSYWVMNNLLKECPDIKPDQVLMVTSRAITRDQQALNPNMVKYDAKILDYWNGIEDDFEDAYKHGINICCYGDIIEAIKSGTSEGHIPLENVRIVIFDECHTLFADEFISGMGFLRAWIVNSLTNKIMFGLTATPTIIDYYNKKNMWGAAINKLNNTPITRYKAKQMICTDFNTIPYLFATERLPGKTIIMCPTVKDCFRLQEKLLNAAIVISPYNAAYKEEMDEIREYIKKHESLPDTAVINGKRQSLEILICTSTLREGFNLRENSGVRNIICCYSDELHITQFAGRCRYDLDNIVVAKTFNYENNGNNSVEQMTYFSNQRSLFNSLINAGKLTSAWFDGVQHLVEHDIYKLKLFALHRDVSSFLQYINSKWLVPRNCPPDEVNHYKIWRQKDKDEIVLKAIQYKLYDCRLRNVTFLRVVRSLREVWGYIIENGRSNNQNTRCRYHLIVDYDEGITNNYLESKGE